MIRNSPKCFLLSLRRIRGGSELNSFGDSAVDSRGLGWALMSDGGLGCGETGGEIEGEKDEEGVMEMDLALMFLVVDMSKGRLGLADLLELRHSLPDKEGDMWPLLHHKNINGNTHKRQSSPGLHTVLNTGIRILMPF